MADPLLSCERLYSCGFVQSSVNHLSHLDAADFMQAVDSGLVTHQDGVFLAPQSKAKEQIFWQGLKSREPRKVTLWLEPIITIAGLMRLSRDFHWSNSLLGLQSKTWEFDLVGYESQDFEGEYLVCEVKKSQKEIDGLLNWMSYHLHTAEDKQLEMKGSEKNAFRKVLALRKSDCPIFWALGPSRYSKVFHVIRSQEREVRLEPADDTSLFAPNTSL